MEFDLTPNAHEILAIYLMVLVYARLPHFQA